MSVVLSTAMERAQQALNGGDYRGAVDTCNRIVAQFPTFAAAYRLLGEAQLEQGQAADAERAFAQALARDPRQAEAYLGLGLIAEERGVLESSLAYCQVAWELAPQQPHFREPVVRVAGRRFGGDGYLQLTHAALAQLHLNAARLHRAANEYQTALVELPDRIDLWIGLALALWRMGRDDDAAEIAREFLNEHAELGQALVILSDIEHRRGNDAEARRLREQLRRVDADGELASALVAANPRAARDFLLLSEDEMPALEERAAQVVNEMPQIAPAPDFDYQPLVPESAGVPGLGLAAALGAAGAVLDATDDEVDLDAELAGLTPMTAEEFGEDPGAEAFSLDDTSVHAFAVAEADLADLPLFEDVDEYELDTQLQEQSSTGAADIDELMLGLEGLEPIDAAEFDASLLAEDSVSDNVLSTEATLGPDAAQAADDDALVDLARALEVDVAVALARAGEPVEAPPEAAVPPGTGYTTLLSELGDEGHTPFDPSRAAQGSSAVYDTDTERPSDELASLTEGWDDLDAEIASAVPVSTGETDELLAMSDIDMAPFSLDEFATDELSGIAPAAGIAPSLPEITSSLSEEPPAAAHDRTDDARDATTAAEDDYLEGIEPFSVEEFDDLNDAEFAFGKLPWETSDDASALPSDADLDAMLADAALPEVVPDEPALVDRDALTEALADHETGDSAAVSLSEEAELTLLETALADVPDQTPAYDLVGADELDASLAVTRELGAPPEADAEFAARLAAMEAAAALNLEQFDAPETAVDDALNAETEPKTVSATDLFLPSDPERLVSDRQLFDRSRAAKDEMVAEGVIIGDLELVSEAAEEAAAPDVQVAAQEQDAQSRPTPIPPSRDVETLMLSLEAAPEDDELHWWLAEALREQGDARAAMNEYRWLIRNAPQRHGQVTDALQVCVEQQQDAELAHRLLSDAYRRHGDTQKASAHAALAMAERRKTR